MAGPGIMVTVMSMIASVVMNSVLTPLFSEFNSTGLQNDLDTLMAPLGGTQNGSLSILNNIAALTSVTSQPGVTTQDSGSGYVAQNTGSSDGLGGGYSLDSFNPAQYSSSSSSSSSCDISAIGTCMGSLFNTELSMGQTALNNPNGAFSILNNVAGELFTAMETLTGSSTTSVPTSASDYALRLGILATVKDVLGLGKTFFSNAGTLSFIQFARTYFDLIQLYLSAQFNEQYPSNIGSSLWVFKSVISTGNDLLTLMDNLNTLTGYFSGFPGQVPLEGQQADLTFHQLTLLERVMVQIIGAVGFILLVLKDYNSIPQNQQATVDVFGFFYVLQRLAKAGHYGYRFANPESTNKRIEQGLYGFSIICNLGQMAETILFS